MGKLLSYVVALAAPCYVANAVPVIVAKVLRRTHPLDGGVRFVDGRRLLGNGKSVEGFIAGVAAGTLVGLVLQPSGLSSIERAFLLSLGSMVGDSLGSFVKRRVGLERGAPAPLLDQLSFLLVALLAYQLAFSDLPLEVAAILVIATPPIHLLANFLAYKAGLKNRPW